MYRYSIVTWNVQRAKRCPPVETIHSILYALKLIKPQILMLQEYPYKLRLKVDKLLQNDKYVSLNHFLEVPRKIDVDIVINYQAFEVISVDYLSFKKFKFTKNPHGALIAKLRNRHTSNELTVINIHLTAGLDWKARISEIKTIFEKVKNDSAVVIGGDFNRITSQDALEIRQLIEQYPGFSEATAKIDRTYVHERIEPANLQNRFVHLISPIIHILGWAKKLDLVISRGLQNGESLTLDTGESDHYMVSVELLETQY